MSEANEEMCDRYQRGIDPVAVMSLCASVLAMTVTLITVIWPGVYSDTAHNFGQ